LNEKQKNAANNKKHKNFTFPKLGNILKRNMLPSAGETDVKTSYHTITW